MNYKIKIHTKSQVFEYSASEGTNLLQFLLRNEYEMHMPCNGQGTCGKCKVKVGYHGKAAEYKLSCQTTISSDMEIYLDATSFQAKIVTEGKQKKLKLVPSVSKKYIALQPPNLNDQRSDSKRLSDFLAQEKEFDTLHLIRQLPLVLHEDNFQATLIFNHKTLIGLEAGDTTSKLYGVAVDIGTTTIAAYLLNLITGERLATYSFLNPQKKYGADVISRIQHTMEEPNGLDDMHTAIIDGINLAVGELTKNAGIKGTDVYEIAFVGNTTMIHFLLKLSAENIASAPFIPAATQTMVINAGEMGIHINKNAVVLVIPSVAAYIGADTVSAVLASEMNKKKGVSLLVDFGTNGEIVLGNNEWLLACSAAAGPAFEGANIRHGVGGVRGAIDSFSIDGNANYTTIGLEKPIGICGTGLVDIVSELYRTGIIDETGRLEKDPNNLKDLDQSLRSRLVKIEEMFSFIVAHENETANNKAIFVTQKDIRELQNAKAAIAAGIRVLANRAGIGLSDIEKVYLAGGFGTYINSESALNIGLIPVELRGKIESIGNAAGIGAMEALASKNALKRAEAIRKEIKYVELSSCQEFNDLFVDSMIFLEE